MLRKKKDEWQFQCDLRRIENAYTFIAHAAKRVQKHNKNFHLRINNRKQLKTFQTIIYFSQARNLHSKLGGF